MLPLVRLSGKEHRKMLFIWICMITLKCKATVLVEIGRIIKLYEHVLTWRLDSWVKAFSHPG